MLESVASVDVVEDEGHFVRLVNVRGGFVGLLKRFLLAILGHVCEFDLLLLELPLVSLAFRVGACYGF